MKRFAVAATTSIGTVLFIFTIRTLGLSQIREAIVRIGWGFGVILLLSGAREVARTLAWVRIIEAPRRLPFGDAFRGRLAGEALNTLLPMGMLVGEPTKAEQVGHRLPFTTAFRALVIELAFYGASLPVLFGAGMFALLPGAAVPAAAAAVVVLLMHIRAGVHGGVTAGISRRSSGIHGRSPGRLANVITHTVRKVQGLARPVLGFASRHPGRVWSIVALEAAYHILAIAEIYVTLMLISPGHAAWTSAVALETVNRAVTMTFKVLPMRMGIDEAGAAIVAHRFDLGSTTGLTLALVRKMRLLFWSAIGLVIMLLRSPRTTPAADCSARSLVATAQGCRAAGALQVGGVTVAFLIALLAANAAMAQSPSGILRAATGQRGIVSGTVSLPAPDGQPVAVPGVTLTLACGDRQPRTDVSNDQGQFRFTDVPAGSCSIVAELQGFSSPVTAIAVEPDATTDVRLRLDLEALHEEVNVTAGAQSLESDPIAAHVETMTASAMQTAPIASERFQDALPLIPGVVRGPDGLLNISGTRSNQSALMFNNADGTDPVTGEDAVELPIDAVSAVQVRGAAFAPEFGLSAGAVTTVETQRAGDAWHVVMNDLEPRPRRRAGEFRGIESWTPRFTTGGPVVKDKVSFLESLQYEYSQTRVFGLPAFESDTKLQSFESYSRLDWTRTAANHVTASAMVSPRKTTYAGLNTFNPQSVTPDIKNHNVFITAADQVVVGSSGFLESRLGVKQFDTTIYPSHGDGPMVLAPDVNSGSYFNSQDRTSRRVEWLTTYAFTPLGPGHLVKAGAGVAYETFDGISRSQPVELVRGNGTVSREISFFGSGLLDRHRAALRGFAQDAWTVSPWLSVQYGARYDYDSFTHDVNVAPRASFTAMASRDGRTVVRGGAGLFYDPIPLNVASFDQMQERALARFTPDSVTPQGSAILWSNRIPSPIHTPRSLTWNLELDREWVKNFFTRVGYQQRDTRFEPILDTAAPDFGDQLVLLQTDGRSRYREAQITGRYQFHGTDQIVASYTRSSAAGNLNDFNSYFGNIQNPVIQPDAIGPLPWDAPNRFLFWSSVTLPRGFSVFPVLDLRTGFPLSVMDEDRNFVGSRNQAGRYPRFVSLDMQVSKRLRILRHNTTVGLKVFNITNHFNPRDYQGNLASASFGGFANSVGRTFRGKWIFEF